MAARTASLRKTLQSLHPWVSSPVLISAPMRLLSGPQLASTVAAHQGIGFLGLAAPYKDIIADLTEVKSQLAKSNLFTKTPSLKGLPYLPVGVGFQTWTGSLDVAVDAVAQFKPRDAWLFAPRHGQQELDEWTVALRKASPDTLIWIQVGTLKEAIAAAESEHAPDILVIQGSEAGGHGRAKDGMGSLTLFPEVFDTLSTKGKEIPLVSAGGIIDGRGALAALSLGASGVAMGTRFLATPEAKISKGYQDAILEGSDAANSTLRTHLYNHLRGTFGWPEEFAPRTLVNKSWEEHSEGAEFDTLKEKHDEALKKGDEAWGKNGRTATYVGAGVGLVHDIVPAAEVVANLRREMREIVTQNSALVSGPL